MSTEKNADEQSGGLGLDGLSLEPIEETKSTVSMIDLVDLPLPEESPAEVPPAPAEVEAEKPAAAKKPPAPRPVAEKPPEAERPPEKPAGRSAPAKEGADGAEQFFQPHVRRTPSATPAAAPPKKALDPKIIAGGGGAAVLLFTVVGWLFLGGDEAPQPAAPQETVQAGPQLPPAVATTQARMTALGRAAKAWMIQFGAGYNPAQVTVERLKSDIKVPEAELLDGWGTPLRYTPKEKGFTIRSAGPDKAFESPDDLTHEESVPR